MRTEQLNGHFVGRGLLGIDSVEALLTPLWVSDPKCPPDSPKGDGRREPLL
jgi:hypothetical protein